MLLLLQDLGAPPSPWSTKASSEATSIAQVASLAEVDFVRARTMDNLFRSLSFVFIFWWLVLYALSGGPWSLDALLRYAERMLWVLGAAAVGVLAAWFVFRQLELREAVRRLRGGGGTGDRFVKECSLGELPTVDLPPPSEKEKKEGKGKLVRASAPHNEDDAWVPQDLRQWWAWYRKQHPAYAEAFVEAWRVMQGMPVPASPYPGGHGGATLLEHAWNVLRTLYRIKPWPEYSGMRNSEGKVVFDLLDEQRRPYRFVRSDALVALCAFAHDIGKVLCYEVDPSGEVRIVKDDHDTVGARLLRTLPSWRALPFDEYQRALVCVGWYHKPLQMPLARWIDDRARALTLLVQHVDELTGQLEGAGHYARYISTPAVSAAGQANAAATQRAAIREASDAPTAPSAPHVEPSTPAPVPQPQGSVHDDHDGILERVPAQAMLAAHPPREDDGVPLAHLSDEEILELTVPVLIKSGAVGPGANSANRVGYKYGSWLYLLDPNLNERMRDHYSAHPNSPFPAEAFERARPSVSSEYSRRLMMALAAKGALKQEHNGQYFGERSAYFLLANANGDEGGPYVIVARAYAFGAQVFNLPDVRREPTIARAVRANQPLQNEQHIELIKQRMQAWSEPTTPLQLKQQQQQKQARQTTERLQRAGVALAPFEPGAVALLSPEELAAAVLKDERGHVCYRADVLLRRFAEPELPHDVIDIDGVTCWRFGRR